MDNERNASKLLLENTEYVPFEQLKAAANKWSNADEISRIVMTLTCVSSDYSLGKNAMVTLNLVDLGHDGKREWLLVGDIDSTDPENVHLRAPRKITPEILQTALMEVFEPPKALALMEKLEAGESVIVKVEPLSKSRAYEEYIEKLRSHWTQSSDK